jgi:hypothetical protein
MVKLVNLDRLKFSRTNQTRPIYMYPVSFRDCAITESLERLSMLSIDGEMANQPCSYSLCFNCAITESLERLSMLSINGEMANQPCRYSLCFKYLSHTYTHTLKNQICEQTRSDKWVYTHTQCGFWNVSTFQKPHWVCVYTHSYSHIPKTTLSMCVYPFITWSMFIYLT